MTTNAHDPGRAVIARAEETSQLRARLTAEIAHRQQLEKHLADLLTAYGRFVPPQLLKLLGKDSILEVGRGHQVEQKMTILFADIRRFASLSERLSPQQCFDFINDYLSFMEPVVIEQGGFIDKYIGDAVMALFPARGDDALVAALGMLDQVARFNERRGQAIEIGIGLNSGLLMLGVIGGTQRMEITVISDAVNLAARVETLTKTWQTPLLITQHTLTSVRDPSRFAIRFIERVRARGQHLAQSIYEVFDADPPDLKAAKLASRDLFEDALAHFHFQDIDAAARLFDACLDHHPGDKPAALYRLRCHLRSDDVAGSVGETQPSWQSAYLTGDARFDGPHQRLFALIVQTAEALRAERTTAAEAHLAALSAEADAHFADEERLMEASDYPHSARAEHIQQHAKLRAYLAALAADVRSARSAPLRLAFRCQFLLLDWFVSHIRVTDHHFARFLTLK